VSKEHFILEEYLETHPSADWPEAYERTAEFAHARSIENIAAIADELKDRRKYGNQQDSG
jgi:hypothetical protein